MTKLEQCKRCNGTGWHIYGTRWGADAEACPKCWGHKNSKCPKCGIPLVLENRCESCGWDAERSMHDAIDNYYEGLAEGE